MIVIVVLDPAVTIRLLLVSKYFNLSFLALVGLHSYFSLHSPPSCMARQEDTDTHFAEPLSVVSSGKRLAQLLELRSWRR